MLHSSDLESESPHTCNRVSSGLIALDLATGYDGIPKGEIIELFGEVDSGKSALALQLVAAFQKSDLRAAYIDVEGKFDAVFAGNTGVILDEILVLSPDSAEETFDTCEVLALGGAIGIIVIDSVTALIPKNELEHGLSPFEIITSGIRRIDTVAKKTGCTIVLVNQVRSNFDSVTASEVRSTGGMVVASRAVVRIQLFRSTVVERGGECVGVNLRARAIKNHFSMRGINIWFVLYFCSGFSIIESVVLNAIEMGVLQKKAGRLYYCDVLLGSKRQEVCDFINSNYDIFEGILRDMREKYLR